MYLDQFGTVRACCLAKGATLGDVRTQTLREIWDSAAAEAIRSALEADDHSQGCGFCAWQLRSGDELVFAENFDRWQPPERRPRWPRRMEFSLTNTCNLACTMCEGNFSSTIRRREGRPPMPAVYGEAFFEQLAEFLPHLEEATFLGGEPFLGREPLRVMSMLAERSDPPAITITTNGTIRTRRTDELIVALRPHIVVSIDGASSSTFDAIRRGARFEQVIASLDHYLDQLGPDRVTIAHCLMATNWWEFSALLTLAEERAIDVTVNVVRFPLDHSLYRLPASELREVVGQLDATEVHLTGSRLVEWDRHREALRIRLGEVELEEAGAVDAPVDIAGAISFLHILPAAPSMDPAAPSHVPAASPSRWPWLPFPEEGLAEPTGPGASSPGPTGRAGPRSLVIEVGTDGQVQVVHAADEIPVDPAALADQPFESFIDALERLHGLAATWAAPPRISPEADDTFAVELPSSATPVAGHLVAEAIRSGDGDLVGGRFSVSWPDPVTAGDSAA